jgi:hypothetical protein
VNDRENQDKENHAGAERCGGTVRCLKWALRQGEEEQEQHAQGD